MEIFHGAEATDRVVPYDSKVEGELEKAMSPVSRESVDAIAEKLGITEPAEVAMLREQDALAVARAHALAKEDAEHDDQHADAQAQPPLPTRVPSPELSPTKQSQGAGGASIDAMIALATEGTKDFQELPHYEPLRGQWHYGQAVLARYKRTPYFHSGNLATYLGAGLFMVVFDDGSLNYRVKREDIVIRPLSTMRSATAEGDENDDEDTDAKENGSGDHNITWYRKDVHLSDKPVMVDFSVSPPRQISAGRAGYDVSDEAWLDVKHLECGVAYEDDSTQVSDSDDSSDEDMTMTPWQQMTQTFGMGLGGGGGGGHRHHKQQRASTRRSSISSLSQIERLSMTGKSMNQILPSPKGIKQTIQDYLAKKTKKVQPSTVSMDPMSEVIRKMEIRRDDIFAIRNGRATSYRTSFTSAVPVQSPSPRPAGPRLERSLSSTTGFHSPRSGAGARDRSASAAGSATASFTVTSISSTGGAGLTTTQTSASSFAGSPSSTRVVFQRPSDGVRSYGAVMSRLSNGDYEVVAESEQTIVVQVLPAKDVDILPSLKELEAQIQDLQQQSKRLYAGRKVQVNLYPGTRFSGNGVITLEDDTFKPGSSVGGTASASSTTPIGTIPMFHVLLQNRIRLINVPADKIVPLKEKKKEPARITEDQFLLCYGKVKVHIGDQVLVKCEGEYEGQLEEKLGVLNGVYSNKTAAIDFADGSTGYEISPSLITKHKRVTLTEDMDLLSLKNAVLMQAAAASPDGFQVEVGYQVKADHPRRASVETCVVIRKHESTACDLKFADGTMAFGVFPSQMIVDKNAVDATMDKSPVLHDAQVGEIVLAWSSRFMRYCSAKISSRTSDAGQMLYTVVFDYGEMKDRVPAEKIARIDDPDALPPPQKLTNYTFDTIGFEIQPVSFSVGEAVMARVHGSLQYFNGRVEAVREKDRACVVVFDSSVRDENVKFSCMFSVDVRNRFRSLGQQTCSGSSSGTGVNGVLDDNASDTPGVTGGRNKRRHSAGSMGSIIMSVAGSIFQARKKAERLERRSSHLVTEVGAIMKLRNDEP